MLRSIMRRITGKRPRPDSQEEEEDAHGTKAEDSKRPRPDSQQDAEDAPGTKADDSKRPRPDSQQDAEDVPGTKAEDSKLPRPDSQEDVEDAPVTATEDSKGHRPDSQEEEEDAPGTTAEDSKLPRPDSQEEKEDAPVTTTDDSKRPHTNSQEDAPGAKAEASPSTPPKAPKAPLASLAGLPSPLRSRSPSLARAEFAEPPAPVKHDRERLSRVGPRPSLTSDAAHPEIQRLRMSLAGGRRSSVGMAAMRRSLAQRASFLHREFANPEAETCWLSCLFQALWHSTVFHAAFEQHLKLSECMPGPEERILAALQATWAEYATGDSVSQDAGQDGGAEVAAGGKAEEREAELVPASGLAEAFGDGYGDMSEALALIQDELSQSSSPAAVAIAEQMVLVPLLALPGSLPGPEEAWKQAEEWQVTASQLIAVDLTLQEPTREESEAMAELWAAQADARSLGSGSHRLVALVCFMWNLRHYVAFCRRQQEPERCIFFNDLPCLTAGAPKDLPWSDVPKLCKEYMLAPRLVLYESTATAAPPCNES